MDSLHFIDNNILTILFKELKKYKNDYQQYLNYIYIYELYYASFCIFKYIHVYAWGYELVYIY